MNLITFFVICAAVSSLDENDENFRKHYGLSFNNRCKNYVKVFKCMSACKAMSFQIFRLNRRCKCTCHEMKTTTILPFFKWRTNGTTRKVPKTFSVQLYHIVGTLSPMPSTEPPATNATTNFTCPTFNFTYAGNDTGGNTTSGVGNDTSSGGEVDGSSASTDNGSSDGSSPSGEPEPEPDS